MIRVDLVSAGFMLLSCIIRALACTLFNNQFDSRAPLRVHVSQVDGRLVKNHDRY